MTTETSQILVIDGFGTVTSKGTKKHKIFLESDRRHGKLDDGRDVFKNANGMWCYLPK